MFSFFDNQESPQYCTEVYELDDLNVWVKVRFEQLLIDGVYKIQLDVNDDIVIDDYEVAAAGPFDDLNVYACEPWHPPAACSIKNLIIRTTPTEHSGEHRRKTLTTVTISYSN